ncbi:pentatricopeptide repeat-containing protein DOT4, chloroplastic-like [Magnolia sinica]|uniref:pentatricopeptide repeat-containing protein DOT4, chloroplastic-like n=1 Tax=Magnolia sinica TaxID=86752 RepID=UPI00265A9568|nr:pentatricopeptide repeat-containing protein DOT4, chloroplastic-like [Magnolia sinica]
MASVSSEGWESVVAHNTPEIDGALLMALLEESQAEETEDDRLGCVMRSLEAEIDANVIDGSGTGPVQLNYDDCMDYGLDSTGLENGVDCSMAMCRIDDPFDWVDMGMVSGPHCDGMDHWYLDTCTDEVGMVEFGDYSGDFRDLNCGKSLHSVFIKDGYDRDVFIQNNVLRMYANCGDLVGACLLFNEMLEPNLVSWMRLRPNDFGLSSALKAYGIKGELVAEKGLDFSMQFISEGYKLDLFTLTSLFNSCSDLEIPALGLQVHCCFVKSGFVLDSSVGSAIIEMYVTFGMKADAYKGFLDVGDKNEICFTAMISGFILDSNVVKLFSKMRKLGLMPKHSTLNYVLGAYTDLDMLEEAKVIHSHIMKAFGESDLCLGNSLIEMYAKCKGVDEAAMVFKEMDMHNEFSWTAIISRYIESKRYMEGLELFCDMHSSTLTKPSQFTTVAVLQACSGLATLDQERQTHAYVIKSGFQSNAFIGSALIDMYAKCSSVNDAFRAFSNMGKQDLFTWSNMMASYAQHGHGEEALKLLSEFQDRSSILVNDSILSSCLSACASLVALDMGKQIHARTIKTGFESHLHVSCGIIDMCCKCGSIEDARKFFYKIGGHNVVSWKQWFPNMPITGSERTLLSCSTR